MSALRSQGRPRRGASEVGRDKIIARLQNVLRTGANVDLSRKTFAAMAGVTPALISYYFPKKEVLYEEISRPVMRYYREEIEKIAAERSESCVKEIVKLLVDMYTKDGLLLDLYSSVMRNSGQSGDTSRCEVTRMRAVLADLFSLLSGRPKTKDFDATVLQGAVWGMCRFAADVEAQRPTSEDEVSLLAVRVVQLLSPSTGIASLSDEIHRSHIAFASGGPPLHPNQA